MDKLNFLQNVCGGYIKILYYGKIDLHENGGIFQVSLDYHVLVIYKVISFGI